MQRDNSLDLISVSYIVMKLSISSCAFWPVGVTSIQTLNNYHWHQCLRSADLNEGSDYNHLFLGQFLFFENNFVPKWTFGIFAATKVILLVSHVPAMLIMSMTQTGAPVTSMSHYPHHCCINQKLLT